MTFDPESQKATLRAAARAQEVWARRSLAERLQPIAKLRATLAGNPLPLAETVGLEIGKTAFEAMGSEVLPVAECCGFLLGRAARVLAPRREVLRGIMPFAGHAEVHHIPWGVVAVLVPWNYPLFLCATSVLPALVAGNAAVMKASPRAEKTVLAFAEALWNAGIPRELAPVLDSSDDAGRALCSSPEINRICFTGGSSTGRSVLTAAAQNLVPATVELSGSDAVFVLRDANVGLAANGVAFGLRINAGRTCICPRRLFVERPVAGEFVQRLKDRVSRAKLPEPMDPQTLREADALQEKLLATGDAEVLVERTRGDALTPILVKGREATLAATQGNFVPALVVSEVADLDDAFALNAASPYALGASVFSRDLEKARAVAGRLRAGMVSINECVATGGEAAITFGGAGESGYGVRGGEEGLREMTRPQTLAIAQGTFRPHHLAGEEAEPMLRALLRARHGGSFFTRMKGWVDYAIAGATWKPKS
jgi:acyl-CoA reductase-like NAD-dependent aldehyde dehydrogenase